MKKLKTSLSVIMVIIIVLAAIVPTYALPKNITILEKAEILNTLSILKGSNGDYKLDQKLKRNEAAAFAVRLMGKEIDALLNTQEYSNITYPDVDKNAWYATYVGLCTKEGIISGDSNGYFKPDDYITEKGFLKIVLSVLGYKIGTDYTWDYVYKKAFEVGLVSDLSYIVKTEDNNEYLRDNTVNVLYNALTIKNKTTGKELFYSLIDARIISKETAVEIGLIEEKTDDEVTHPVEKDETPTSVEEVLVFDSTKIAVHFNEMIQEIDSIKIYEAADPKKVLEAEIEMKNDNSILLKTKIQTPGLEYLVEMNGIKDKEGNILQSLVGAFNGYVPVIVESNFFRIQKIRPVNESSILLFFTHPVNLNTENAAYYTIYDGSDVFVSGEDDELIARIYSSETNCIMLSLRSAKFTADREYIVEIAGNMTSAYGVRINDHKGDRMGFTAIAGKEEKFKLNEVIPYNNRTVMLIFNKDINPFLAEQIYNFYLTDEDGKPYTIEKTTMMDNIYLMAGQTLFISLKNELEKNKKYYLTINNLNDISRQEYISESVYSFTASYGNADRLRIDRISAVNKQKIEVYFTNSLDQTTAMDKQNYTITYRYDSKSIIPAGVIYDPNDDPLKVTIYLSDENKLVGNREYELQISKSLRDYIGNTMEESIRRSFISSTDSKDSPSIDDAYTISSDAVKLVFNDAVAFDRINLSPENFTLEYNYNGRSIRKIPLSVLYADAKTIILKFDELMNGLTYTLKFNSIMDYAGTSFKVSGDGTNYIEFEVKEE